MKWCQSGEPWEKWRHHITDLWLRRPSPWLRQNRSPPETHLKLKSRQIPSAHNLLLIYPIVLNFCTELGSDTSKWLSNWNLYYGRRRFSYISVNSLSPSDAIWRQRSGSTLAQVMACCLTAPSHYLNQCSLTISEVQWHSCEGIFHKRYLNYR